MFMTMVRFFRARVSLPARERHAGARFARLR